MTDFSCDHTPSPEFRARLEQDLLAALQRETRFAPLPPSARVTRWRRLRSAALLFVGLVLGVGTSLASGQVQESRERSMLVQLETPRLEMARLRLVTAEQNLERSRKLFDAGVITPAALREAEAAVLRARHDVELAELNLAEIRASSSAPRDELTAPLVGGRDFVQQRLQVEAELAQSRLTQVTRDAEQTRSQFDVGVVTRRQLEQAELAVAGARRDVEEVGLKLRIRAQLLAGDLDAQTAGRELELYQQRQRLEEVVRVMREATEAIERLRASHDTVSAAARIEMKRAELDILEQQQALRQLEAQIRALQSGRHR